MKVIVQIGVFVLLCFPRLVLGQDEEAGQKNPKNVAQLLVGKWGVDVPRMVEEGKKAIEKSRAKGGDELAEARLKEMTQMFEKMGHLMMVELTAYGKSISHSPDGDETGKHRLFKVDNATGDFTIEMIDKRGKKQTTTGQVKGDKMFLKDDERSSIHLKRLKAEEAKKIEAAIAEAREDERPEPEVDIDPPAAVPE